jgi:hypothetical protein
MVGCPEKLQASFTRYHIDNDPVVLTIIYCMREEFPFIGSKDIVTKILASKERPDNRVCMLVRLV